MGHPPPRAPEPARPWWVHVLRGLALAVYAAGPVLALAAAAYLAALVVGHRMTGRRRQDRDLMAPVLAMLRERGPAHTCAVRHQLIRDGRVRTGTTMGDTYEAAKLLAADGQVEHVTRAGATGGGYFRVPGDDRPRWDQ